MAHITLGIIGGGQKGSMLANAAKMQCSPKKSGDVGPRAPRRRRSGALQAWRTSDAGEGRLRR